MTKVAPSDFRHSKASVKSEQFVKGFRIERRPTPGFVASFFRHYNHAFANTLAYDVLQFRSGSNMNVWRFRGRCCFARSDAIARARQVARLLADNPAKIFLFEKETE